MYPDTNGESLHWGPTPVENAFTAQGTRNTNGMNKQVYIEIMLYLNKKHEFNKKRPQIIDFPNWNMDFWKQPTTAGKYFSKWLD